MTNREIQNQSDNRHTRRPGGHLILLGVICLTWLSAECPAQTVRIAADGQALLPIVVAEKSSERTQLAARTFARQLRRITDAEFTIQQADGTTGLVIGTVRDFPKQAGDLPREPKDDEREMYRLRSDETGVKLIGTTDLAVEHAVWDLLYRLGYRQYFPGPTWEIVPHAPELSVHVNVTERPSYLTRQIWYGYGPWDHAAAPYQDWCGKNRATNGIELDTGHIGELLRERYKAVFAQHPEYLALVDGQRTSDKFCISHPELRKLVIGNALDHFARNPESDSLSVEPSDGLGWCECEACARLGSPSDRAVLLASEVATAVEAKHPGKRFGMYAYGGHVAPPKIDVHPRVVISVATAFGSAGLTLDELMAGWRSRGATLGIREYFSVHPWDRDLPGAARGGNLEYLARTIPHFHQQGARFFSAESSDNWGPNGLGYFLAARMLWNLNEASPERIAELRTEFLQNAFGAAAEPMERFYQLLDSAKKPLLSDDLIGRMYRLLAEARQAAASRNDVLARLDHLVLYTHYVERWFDYTQATGEARQAAFENMIRHAWRMRDTMMIHVLALYRDVVTRDSLIRIPSDCEYHVPEGRNQWKSSEPFAASEIDAFLRDGIAKYQLFDFDAVSFSEELVPATALKLPDVEPGQYGLFFRDEFDVFTWADQTPTEFPFKVKAGLIYGRLGDAKFSLFPRDELQGKSVDNAVVPPDKQPHDVTLRSAIPGLQRLHLSDGGDGTEVTWLANTPLTIRSDPAYPAMLHSRWTLYFYVPRGTKVIGGFADGPGELRDPDGRTVFKFGDAPGYFNVPVPAGNDRKLWKFHHGNGRRLLMTVPPYLARTPQELLLPREVVERDTDGE